MNTMERRTHHTTECKQRIRIGRRGCHGHVIVASKNLLQLIGIRQMMLTTSKACKMKKELTTTMTEKEMDHDKDTPRVHPRHCQQHPGLLPWSAADQ